MPTASEQALINASCNKRQDSGVHAGMLSRRLRQNETTSKSLWKILAKCIRSAQGQGTNRPENASDPRARQAINCGSATSTRGRWAPTMNDEILQPH
mmetsp:Transcript_10689/g.22983  ORF Transcript_10689/g.22983 Transcript_10689/m.22983 type:complete len:97 (-) Transcript_10689:874-1164(-)